MSAQPPKPPPPSPEELLKAAEKLKQKGDLSINRGQYAEAIPLYDDAIKMLEPFRGGPLGEKLAVQALSSKAQCYFKLGDFETARDTIDFALSVPIISFETNLMSKLYHRKGLALKGLGMLKDAYIMVHRALAIGGGDVYGWEQDRLDLMKGIKEEEAQEKAGRAGEEDEEEEEEFEFPGPPDTISSQEAMEAIAEIVKSGANAAHMIPWLEKKFVENKKGQIWWDRREDKNKLNMIFAVCNVAMVKAVECAKKFAKHMSEGAKKEDLTVEFIEKEGCADDCFPLLQYLFQKGARAEQRYPMHGNRTPLQMLCLAGAEKCVEEAIKYGATPYVYDDTRWTPLLVSLTPDRPCGYKSSAMIVDMLISKGARVNHVNHIGMCPLSLAAQSGDAKCLRSLLSTKDVKLNLRSAENLFSSVIWAKIADAQECVDLIKEAVFEQDKSPTGNLKMEVLQDIALCDFSTIVFIAKNRWFQLESTSDRDEKNKLIVAFIQSIFKFPPDSEQFQFTCDFERIHRALLTQFPIAASIRYGLKSPADQSAAEAMQPKNLMRVIQRLPFHISCAFNTLYLLRGPPKEGVTLPPPIMANDRNSWYYLTMFDDFHELFIQPLQSSFGYFLPSVSALNKMQTLLTSPESIQLTSLSFKEVDAKTALHTSNVLTAFAEKFPNSPQNSIPIDRDSDLLMTLSSALGGSQGCFFLDSAALAASSSFRGKGITSEALADTLLANLTGKLLFAGFEAEMSAGEEKYERSGSFCDLDDAVRDLSQAVFDKFKKSSLHKVELLTALPHWVVAPHGIFLIEKNA